MQYLMMICLEESFTPTELVLAETHAWVEEMDRRGVRLRGDRLRPASDATTVRVRDDEVVLGDGPFAETKEQIAGFDIIECDNLDVAIEVAAAHPAARLGTVEVRPIWPI